MLCYRIIWVISITACILYLSRSSSRTTTQWLRVVINKSDQTRLLRNPILYQYIINKNCMDNNHTKIHKNAPCKAVDVGVHIMKFYELSTRWTWLCRSFRSVSLKISSQGHLVLNFWEFTFYWSIMSILSLIFNLIDL